MKQVFQKDLIGRLPGNRDPLGAFSFAGKPHVRMIPSARLARTKRPEDIRVQKTMIQRPKKYEAES